VFLVVTYADGHLYIKNEGAKTEPARMFAETPLKFYLTIQEVELTFDPRVAGTSSLSTSAASRAPSSCG